MLTPYLDAKGTLLGNQSYPLPIGMTLGFSETEQFDELRGDDTMKAVHGRGSQVDWSLEAGGMNMQAWSIITGGSVTVAGVAPTRTVQLQKASTTQRPYFRIDGRVISDSGGNIVARIYRAKANGRIRADMKHGAFQTSQIDGIGAPLVNDDASWLYTIIQNETDSPLSGTPQANPIPVPTNVIVGAITTTSAALSWTAIGNAQSFQVQQSIDGGVTWTNIAAGTNAVWTLAFGGTVTGGTFTVSYGGQTTSAIAYNATAAQVQAALQSLSTIGSGNVTVTGGPGPTSYVVTFVNALGNAPITGVTVNAASLTGTSPTLTPTNTTPGVVGGGQPTVPTTNIDTLTTHTAYQFRVASVINSVIGAYSTPVSVVTN
jgi:hypothetical protein